MGLLVAVLSAVVLFATLIGEPDMPTLSYTGGIDFDYHNPFFEGRSQVAQVFVDGLEYPFPTVNFTADPGNDSVWGFSAITALPAPIWIANESGLLVMNYTLVSLIGIRNWEYFVVQQSIYWFNASSFQGDMDLRLGPRSPYAWPWLTFDSIQPRPSADIFTFATFRSVSASSRITVVGRNLTLQFEGGGFANMTGRASITIRSFDEAHFWRSTARTSVLLHPGAHVSWFSRPFTLRDVSGYVEAATGDQRLLSNATVVTLTTPRVVTLQTSAVAGDFSRIVIRLNLETTTLEVDDGLGHTIVGAQNKDVLPISGWPGKWLNLLLVVAATGALVTLSWMAVKDD